eukprot:COSAG06_NODE_164_length_21596_cov_37.740500_10_plen_129_part_00
MARAEKDAAKAAAEDAEAEAAWAAVVTAAGAVLAEIDGDRLQVKQQQQQQPAASSSSSPLSSVLSRTTPHRSTLHRSYHHSQNTYLRIGVRTQGTAPVANIYIYIDIDIQISIYIHIRIDIYNVDMYI